jgi:hypothetical protein
MKQRYMRFKTAGCLPANDPIRLSETVEKPTSLINGLSADTYLLGLTVALI